MELKNVVYSMLFIVVIALFVFIMHLFKEVRAVYLEADELKKENETLKTANYFLRGEVEEKTASLIEARREAHFYATQLEEALTAEHDAYREVEFLGDDFEVTWYNDYGKTKNGRFVEDQVTAAVDPDVIPLGSWIKLEFPNGDVMIRRADDTGSAVKGHIVDIYLPASDDVLYDRGRTFGVKVTIIERK